MKFVVKKDFKEEHAMTEQEQAIQNPDFKDRKTGLVVFGIFQIILGIICALMVPLMIFSVIASSAAKNNPASPATIIPGILGYILLAVCFVWLGIGSIKARRWARALVLVSSWIWLIGGIAGMFFFLSLMPDIYRRMPPEMARTIKYVVTAIITVIYIIIPGAHIIFYGRKNVKATCEARDTQVRWTDKCPLPVLAVSIMFAGWAFSMLFMGFSGWAVPFFGFILNGIPGAAVLLTVALLSAYITWGTYKLDIAAWRAAVILTVGWGFSAIITFSRVSMPEFYRKMKFSEQQLYMIEQYDIFKGSTMNLYIGLCAVVFLGFLIYIKRYFVVSEFQPDTRE